MSEALDPTRKDMLSSHLDHEAENGAAAEGLIHGNFSAQLHFRNLESVSRATKQTGTPAPAADDFLSRIMGAIDGLEQENPADDFEVLSAWTDGEWDLETDEITVGAEVARHQIQLLGQAMRALPVPAASGDFVTRVMAAVSQAEAPTTETLSALYDAETSFAEVRHLSGTELPAPAQTQLQNFATLSSALRRLPLEVPENFAFRVMEALPQPATDFDSLSAYHDLEANQALVSTPTRLKDFESLSAGFAALPEITAPADFAARVMQAVDAADFESASAAFDGEAEAFESPRTKLFAALSAGFAALPEIQAPHDFAHGVMMAIEADFAALSAHHDGEAALELDDERQAQLRLLEALSSGFAALPSAEAPAGFAERVMAAIDALPAFDDLSAAFDGEAQLDVSDAQLQPLRALSQAMKALPAYEAPADFVAKVMLATEAASKPKLFALPKLLNNRFGQVAAGIALFGMLALMTQQLLGNGTPGNGPVTAAVPVVQVENTAEDMLFNSPVVETVMDDTMELETSTDNDYNSWIGG